MNTREEIAGFLEPVQKADSVYARIRQLAEVLRIEGYDEAAAELKDISYDIEYGRQPK